MEDFKNPALLEGEVAPKKENTSKKAKRTVNQFFVTINRARKVFDMQLDKSNDLKLRCLKKELGRERDLQKFYGDYQQYVKWLMDSNRFVSQCKDLKYNPEIVASHIIFLGSAVMHKVRENGIYDPCIVADLDLYKEAFMPENAQEFAHPTA